MISEFQDRATGRTGVPPIETWDTGRADMRGKYRKGFQTIQVETPSRNMWVWDSDKEYGQWLPQQSEGALYIYPYSLEWDIEEGINHQLDSLILDDTDCFYTF